ncbi:MAG: GDSL-type esterase/lipase family protein [Pseudomonadota bacterium]
MIPRRIVFAGSSSIHGRGDPEFGGFVHRFRLWHEARSPRHFVYGLGIFGESTASLMARIGAEARARRPHLIVLYPGFNDIRRDGGRDRPKASSLEAFAGAMTSLVTELTAIAPLMVMTGFPFDESRTCPFHGSESFYLSADAERYTQRLRSVCVQAQVPVLDYYSLWSSISLDGLLAEDGLHANPAGHRLLFEQLRDDMLDRYG